MKTKFRCLFGIFTFLGFVSMETQTHAASFPFPPDQKAICVASSVDKDKLATYLLQKYPVSLLAATSCLGKTQVSGSPRGLLGALLSEEALKTKECPEADRDNLYVIRGSVNSLLAGRYGEAYSPSARVPADVYLQGTNNETVVVCKTDVAGAPIDPMRPAAAPALSATSNIRLRGNPNHLIFDRSTPNFQGTDKATLNFNANDVAGSRTSKATGYVGYALRLTGDNPDTVDVIPYLGFNRNVTTVSSGATAKPSLTHTSNIGLLASIDVLTRLPFRMDHILNIRPDFLHDHKNGSSILSLNTEYTPVVSGIMNGFSPISQGSTIYFKPIFILKANAGAYTNRGDTTVTSSNKNFFRMGPQIGLSVVTDTPMLPLEFSSTYTRLAAVTGDTTINYRKNTINYSLDAKNYVGLGLSRVSGIREDTGKTEKQWEVGLTVRY